MPQLSTYPGATDDDRLTRAIAVEIGDGTAAFPGSPFPRPIAPDLGRRWQFTRRQRITHGFQLDSGVRTVGQVRSQRTLPLVVGLATPGGWLDVQGDQYGNAYGVNIANLSITGSKDSALLVPETGAVLVDSWLSGISTVNFTPYGTPAQHQLFRGMTMTGWSNHNNLPNPIRIGGSDNTLWPDGALIDSPPNLLDAGGRKFLLELAWLSKSAIGPIYVTCEANSGIWAHGAGELLSITGAKTEGRNAGRPAFGSVVRVDNDVMLDLNSHWFGFGMAAPVKTGRNDGGMLHVQGRSQVTVTGGQYRPAQGVDVPFAWVGRDCRLSVTGLKSPGVTGVPRVVAERGARVDCLDGSVRVDWV